MKRLLENIALISAGIIIVAGGVTLANQLEQSDAIPFGSAYGPTILETLTQIATSTSSFDLKVPVKLLDADTNRTYAAITNPSDKTMYLTVTSTELFYNFDGSITDSGQIATSTITSFSGISIAAGGMYEITDNNLITGYIYATSSDNNGVKKLINVSYK